MFSTLKSVYQAFRGPQGYELGSVWSLREWMDRVGLWNTGGPPSGQQPRGTNLCSRKRSDTSMPVLVPESTPPEPRRGYFLIRGRPLNMCWLSSGRQRQNGAIPHFSPRKVIRMQDHLHIMHYDFHISKLPLNIRCSEEILVKLSQTNMISFL